MSVARFVTRLVPLTLLLCAPIGCGRVAEDSDEASQFPLDSTRAVIRNDQPHTGAYFAGPGLGPVPALPADDRATDRTIQIDVVNVTIDLAPGVKFSAWTFGGTVPGPVVRVRVGDRVHFSLTNRSDREMPGMKMSGVPMMHSIDFHAALVAPDDEYRSIAPGQTISFEFTPHYPGVFMYHCGTPMVLEHIASGMYGMVVVEPRRGFPGKVDREYCVVQSEFYTKPGPPSPDGGPVVHVLDTDKVRTKASTYTVFNGQFNGMVEHPLTARPGERVRLYVLNAGPSNTSSFHVVGTIFDRVWIDGNPANQFRGMQTVLLPSSGGAIVEFLIPERGKYVMVDHHFANASQGAIGVIDATGAAESGPIEHHNIAASADPDDPVAARGKNHFDTACLACHTIGGGNKIGPDLWKVAERRPEAWLRSWLKDPDRMLSTDDTAKALLQRFNGVPMPNQNLTAAEIDELVRYLRWAAGQPAPEPAHAHE